MTRLARLLTLFFVLAPLAAAQKHYLVSPDQEIVPVSAESAARDLVRRAMEAGRDRAASNCTAVYYPMEPWNVNAVINGTHLDVLAQWYTAPVSGSIDTIYFYAGPQNGAYDSTVFLRIHRSNIGPGYGPGVRPGPFEPPCQSWGYWKNSNDLDQGVAAFPQEATDTNWVSMYRPWTVASTPPFGEELWGGGGTPIHVHAGEINAVALADVAPLQIGVGDKFLISMRVAYDPLRFNYEFNDMEQPFQLGAASMKVSAQDEFYPSRNWKFYEHDKGPSSCGDWPRDSLTRGWYARGTASGDSTEVMLWSIWYSMTTTGNKPPVVVEQTELTSTFDTSSRPFYATIEDCAPQFCGVTTARLRYDIDGVEQQPIAMNPLGGDVFEVMLPGQPPGSRVTGRIEATDCENVTAQGPSFDYSVVPFGNGWYALDTGYACTPRDIRSTGTTLDPASFVVHPWSWTWRRDEEWVWGLPPTRDGTSGPYDLGGNLMLFDDEFRYAWIGVNGGIALTKTSTESLDVNSSLQFLAPEAAPWEFPSSQKHDRETSTHLMPGMFIAPFWADHVLADSTPPFGRILVGDAGDSCLFVAEWDSIGRMTPFGPESTSTTFRVVLDRCGGSVEFQYGSGGDWSAYPQSLTGMQADSNAVSGPFPGYVALSRDGHPSELAPADGRCIRMVPTVGTSVRDGWNLVAVSYAPLDGDYRQAALFPELDPGWAWNPLGGYERCEGNQLMEPGNGRWVKVGDGGRYGRKPGTSINELFIPVQNGWNLIGGLSVRAFASDVIPVPPTRPHSMSDFFGYDGDGYTVADVIEPGKAYWVKLDNVDGLMLVSTVEAPLTTSDRSNIPAASLVNSITIRDGLGRSRSLYISPAIDESGVRIDPEAFELPPVPPEGAFDVRFITGRTLEVISGSTDAISPREFTISIHGARYPVTVEWNIGLQVPGGDLHLLAPSDADHETAMPLGGTGSLSIDALPTGLLMIRVDGSTSAPSEFALGANYPNPFNPATTFNVDIPIATDVRVEVVDILGRNIAELLTGPQAGSHRLIWNGLDRNGVAAPSGVYIVRLTSGSFIANRKAVLIR